MPTTDLRARRASGVRAHADVSSTQRRLRTALLGLCVALVLTGAVLLVRGVLHNAGGTGGTAPGGARRGAVAGSFEPTTAPAPAGAGAVPGAGSGRPVRITLPFPSTHFPHGLTARVEADRLNSDGSLFVPADPRLVSWAAQDAAPGGLRGTAILVSHVNFVVDGRTVTGAFADLAEYGATSLGHTFALTLADGRSLTYRVQSVQEVDKRRLAGDSALRRELFDQSARYGTPPRGRLLLVSCGGPFDPATGSYRDNVFLYALPVTAA